MASVNMQESQNPKPSAEGIAGMPPRQLAPSVGITLVTGAPSAISSASSTRADPICFGSFEFALHEPALQPVFADLSNSMELTFGCFRYSVNAEGTLRFPIASTTTFTALLASTPVRVMQIASTSTLASASAPASPARSTSAPASSSSIASASELSSSLQLPEPAPSQTTLSPSTSCEDIMSYSTPSEWSSDSST